MIHDELRKLAEDIEHQVRVHETWATPVRDYLAQEASTLRAILSRFPDPPGDLIECGGEAPPVFASKIDPPATEEELREKIAIELCTNDTGYIGGGWGGESESEQRIWLEKADRIMALLRPSPASEQLREADPRIHDLISAANAVLESDDEGDYQRLRESLAALTRPPQEEIEGPFTFDELVEHTAKEPSTETTIIPGWNKLSPTAKKTIKDWHEKMARLAGKTIRGRIADYGVFEYEDMGSESKEPPAGKRWRCKSRLLPTGQCDHACLITDQGFEPRACLYIFVAEEWEPVVEEKAP